MTFQEEGFLPNLGPGTYAAVNPFSSMINVAIPSLTRNVTVFNTTTSTWSSVFFLTTLGQVLTSTLYQCSSVPYVTCNMNDTLTNLDYGSLSVALNFSRADQTYIQPWDSQRWFALIDALCGVLVAILVFIGYMFPGAYRSIIALAYFALGIVTVVSEAALLQMISIVRNSFPNELTISVYIPTTLILATFFAVLAFGFWWQNGMSAYGERDLMPTDVTRAAGKPVYEQVRKNSSSRMGHTATQMTRRNSRSVSRVPSQERATVAIDDT